jgi:hypothetical protein
MSADDFVASYLIADRQRDTARFVTHQAQLRALAADRPVAARPARRRAVAQWAGTRLIAWGLRLRGAAVPLPSLRG